jgi:anti-sigma B factor antagonist
MTRTAWAHFLLEKTIDGVTVASFADAELLDERVIGEVEEELWEIAYGLGAASLLLGFGRVRLMSSCMLGVLLLFSRRFQVIGGRLKLCDIAPRLREVFRIARYEGLFEIYPDEMQALDAF